MLEDTGRTQRVSEDDPAPLQALQPCLQPHLVPSGAWGAGASPNLSEPRCPHTETRVSIPAVSEGCKRVNGQTCVKGLCRL